MSFGSSVIILAKYSLVVGSSPIGKLSSGSSGGGTTFVDCIFCLFWSMCPFAVARVLGRCLVMLEDVNPGQVAKLPLLMAFSRVWWTGL